MTVLDLAEIAQAGFQAEPSYDGREICVRFRGTADAHALTPLEGMLRRLHNEAVRLGCPRVVIDFLALEFMNSSCFKAFVSWIVLVQDVEDQRQQYRIAFRSSADMPWQRRSLRTLACFAPELITVET